MTRRNTMLVSTAKWLSALAILFFLVRHLYRNIDELRTVEFSFNLPVLAFSCVLLVVYFFSKAFIWHFITSRSGVSPPVRKSLVIWFFSLAGKYVPGKAFTLLLRLHHYGRANVSAGRVTLCYGVETVCTMAAFTVVALLAFLFADLGSEQTYRPILWIMLGCFVVSIHPKCFGFAINLARRVVGKEPVDLRLTFTDTLTFLGMMTTSWLVAATAFFFLADSLFDLEFNQITHFWAAFSLASLAGILSFFTPSGLGVREGVLSLVLLPIMPSSAAVLLALTARVWFILCEVICIGIAFVLDRTE